MSKKFLTNIDLGASATIIALAPSVLGSNPGTPKLGQIYFNNSDNTLRYYDGTWRSVGSSTSASSFTLGSTLISLGGTTTSVSGLTLVSPTLSGTVTGNGTIPPSILTASSVTIAGTAVGLGGTLSSIGISYLSASSVTVGSTAIGLGGTTTTIAGLTSLTSTTLIGTTGNITTVNSNATNTGTISASGIVSITNSTAATDTTHGALVVTGGAGILGDVYIGGNLNVTGSGFFGGSAVNISASNLSINDSLIYLATGNTANLQDIGFIGHYTTSSYAHTGLFRDHNDSKWKLFSGASAEPTGNSVDLTGAVYDTLKIGALEVTSTTQVSNFNAQYVGGKDGSTVTQKFSVSIGDGAATSYTASHNLGTRDVEVQVYDNSTYETVEVDVVRTTASVVTLTFASAPSSNAYRVVVIG